MFVPLFFWGYASASCHSSAGRSTIWDRPKSKPEIASFGFEYTWQSLNANQLNLTQDEIFASRGLEERSPLQQLDNRSNYTKHTNQLQLGDLFERRLAAGALGKQAPPKCFALISKRMRKRRNLFIRQKTKTTETALGRGKKKETSCNCGIQSG